MQIKKHHKFTLVELLVVIAIISILASMLLPALAEAQRMAKVATCQGTLKQISLAINMYTSDYSGWLPTHGSFANGGASLERTRSDVDSPLEYMKLGLLMSDEYITRKTLFCQGQSYSDLGPDFNAYHVVRRCTYSYFLPLPDGAANISFKITKAIENSNFWYAGAGGKSWKAIAACRLNDPSLQAATTQPGGSLEHKNIAHGNSGTNIARLDGSVWFLRRPGDNLWTGYGYYWAPSSMTYGNKSVNVLYWDIANEQ